MLTREQYLRARDVFLEAIRLAPDSRASYLDEACERESEIRREVESLLLHLADATVLAQATRPSRGDEPIGAVEPAPRIRHSLDHRLDASWLAGSWKRRGLLIGVTAVLAVAIGTWIYVTTRAQIREVNAAYLRSIVDASVTGMRFWIDERKAEVEFWASDDDLRAAVEELLEIPRQSSSRVDLLRAAPAQRRLRAVLDPYVEETDGAGFFVFDDRGLVIASSSTIGFEVSANRLENFGRIVFRDETVFLLMGLDSKSLAPAEVAGSRELAVSAAGVHDEQGKVIAVFALARDVARGVGQIIRAARPRKTGETYAFDENAVLLTESRFGGKLEPEGAVPGRPSADSAPWAHVRDPGVDLSKVDRATDDPHARPLTKLAALAIASRFKTDPVEHSGILLDPYRNYRGRRVIGAWSWLPDLRFGIAAEVETSEAYAPIHTLSVEFLLLLIVLALVVGISLVSSSLAVRFRSAARQSDRMGSYTLEEQIGEGGMGKEYLARHTLLKRPTVIKLLRQDLANDLTRSRFEREARLASRLSHPNTIEVYDFGTTPDGRFYYAMEYLDGLNLAELVDMEGPIPVARSVFILRQVCGSLREAHDLGLIHRDIKPSNIMLCVLGGEYDFVKVLDFGLVKDLRPLDEGDATIGDVVGGTPLFMPPEQYLSPLEVDARSDLFAFGSVAYYLLVGQPIFPRTSAGDLAVRVATEEPEPPSAVAPAPIPPALEHVVMRCLERNRDDRPSGAAEVLAVLDEVQHEHPWTQADAKAWWEVRA